MKRNCWIVSSKGVYSFTLCTVYVAFSQTLIFDTVCWPLWTNASMPTWHKQRTSRLCLWPLMMKCLRFVNWRSALSAVLAVWTRPLSCPSCARCSFRYLQFSQHMALFEMASYHTTHATLIYLQISVLLTNIRECWCWCNHQVVQMVATTADLLTSALKN